LSVVVLIPTDAVARIEVKSKLLEDLLEALAKIEVPIDPRLEHDMARGLARVEFDIASEHVSDLEDVLCACGLRASSLQVRKRILNDGALADPFDTESERGV
jgi:hypothetical protein